MIVQIAAESLLFLMIIVSWLNGIKRRSSDGKGVMRFKLGSPLEWFYPAASLELNRLDAYDRGISDEWVNLSVYEDIFESKDYYVVR